MTFNGLALRKISVLKCDFRATEYMDWADTNPLCARLSTKHKFIEFIYPQVFLSVNLRQTSKKEINVYFAAIVSACLKYIST